MIQNQNVDVNYKNPTIKTIFKFKDSDSYAKEVIIHANGDERILREAQSIIEDVYGQGYVTRYDFQDRKTYEGEISRREGSNSGTDSDGEVQYQQRTSALTDREVLEYASEKLASTPIQLFCYNTKRKAVSSV